MGLQRRPRRKLPRVSGARPLGPIDGRGRDLGKARSLVWALNACWGTILAPAADPYEYADYWTGKRKR
jgi:hypothetical protein